jgi:hypothetical protein
MRKIVLLITFIMLSSVITKESWWCDSKGKKQCPNQNQTCCQSATEASRFKCWNYQDGVCCTDGLHICSNGDTCNKNNGSCDYKRHPQQCGNSGKNCPVATQTCCEGPNGWGCRDIGNGVCCMNGVSACPPGNRCDLQADPRQGCKPLRLFFLDTPETDMIVSKPFEQYETFEPIDAEELFEGFMDGIQIFTNLPHAKSCDLKTLDTINHDINDIIRIVRDIHWDASAVTKVMQLVAKLQEIYEAADSIVGPCEEFGKEIKSTLKDVIHHMKSATFAAELVMHIMMDVSALQTKLHDANDLYKSHNFPAAGKGYGDLVHEALLWNYQK